MKIIDLIRELENFEANKEVEIEIEVNGIMHYRNILHIKNSDESVLLEADNI